MNKQVHKFHLDQAREKLLSHAEKICVENIVSQKLQLYLTD